MSIKESYEKKLREVENFDERKLIQDYCFGKLKQLLVNDFNAPYNFHSYFKISLSTNNISVRFGDHNIDFYSNIEFKINRKNKSFEYELKDYSLNNLKLDSDNINLINTYTNLLNSFIYKVNYDFLIELFNKKHLLKKQESLLKSEFQVLEQEYFKDKYKKEIKNIETILKPISENKVQEYLFNAKKGNLFNLVIKKIDKENIVFENTIFFYENNTFYINHQKVKKDIFIENLKRAFTFENKVVNNIQLINNIIKSKNKDEKSFNIEAFHKTIMPLVIKEKSEVF